MVKLEQVSYKTNNKTLLEETTLEFKQGLFHVIMGANGAGKSTLLKMMAGYLPSATGTIHLGGKLLEQYTTGELARKRAVLSQHYAITFPVSVREIVLMGRYPYFKANPTAIDLSICKEALRLMDMELFEDRDYQTLSGGEAQKVQMCRVLAQIWKGGEADRKVLFLDEPVSHLDIKYQYQLLKIAKELCNQQATVIAVLHDVNLALSYADQILFMKEGKIIHKLEDPALIKPEIIQETFGMRAKIIHDKQHERPVIIF